MTDEKIRPVRSIRAVPPPGTQAGGDHQKINDVINRVRNVPPPPKDKK